MREHDKTRKIGGWNWIFKSNASSSWSTIWSTLSTYYPIISLSTQCNPCQAKTTEPNLRTFWKPVRKLSKCFVPSVKILTDWKWTKMYCNVSCDLLRRQALRKYAFANGVTAQHEHFQSNLEGNGRQSDAQILPDTCGTENNRSTGHKWWETVLA